MKLTDDVVAALRAAETDGCRLTLVGPRMDRDLYQQVNDVLEAVGGQWTSSAGAHVFPLDAATALAPVLTAGEVVTLREKRQNSQYFPTPAVVVERLIELADLKPGMEVLEPSAGSGAIAVAALAGGAVVDCIERDPGYAAELSADVSGRSLTVADFLSVPARPAYDRVLMNPPFTRGADITHVQHALRFLKPGGLLVAVMSLAVAHRVGGLAAKLRHLVEQRGGTVETVKAGAFKESGTSVPTLLVTIPATRCDDAPPIVWPGSELVTVPDEPATWRSPAEILDDLRADLAEAMRLMDELARDLATPLPAAVDGPVPRPEPSMQLAFDETEPA